MDKEIIESWGLFPPDFNQKLLRVWMREHSLKAFYRWYRYVCKKEFGGKCVHRIIDDEGTCHILSSCPFYKLQQKNNKNEVIP